MELMLVAGEASGDAHAAELIAELRCRHPELRVFGCGGPQMAAAGCELLVSTDDLAVMGLAEVIGHLPRLHRLLQRLRRALRERRPAAIILVDFPDFNLRLAASAKAAGVPAICFISPQLWAWRSGRARHPGRPRGTSAGRAHGARTSRAALRSRIPPGPRPRGALDPDGAAAGKPAPRNRNASAADAGSRPAAGPGSAF